MFSGIGSFRDLGNPLDPRRSRSLPTPAAANVPGLPAANASNVMSVLRSQLPDYGENPIPGSRRDRIQQLAEVLQYAKAQGLDSAAMIPDSGFQSADPNIYSVGRSQPSPAPGPEVSVGRQPWHQRINRVTRQPENETVLAEVGPFTSYGETAAAYGANRPSNLDKSALTSNFADSLSLPNERPGGSRGIADPVTRGWGAGGMFTHLPTGTLSPIPDERGRPVTIRTDPLLTQQRRKVKEWEQSDPRKIPDRGIGPVLRGESDAIYVEDPNIQNNQERSDRQPNVFEILQPREGSIDPETQAILEEYSRAMINETDVRNLDNESFTQIPGIGRHIPREWGSDIVGGIHAYGPVPMEYRYTDANGREQFAVKNVYPSEIAQTVGEDPDAKFYNERFGQKPLGKVAGDARRAAKTPLISRSELVEAYKSGKMTVPAETKGNLVGFLGRGGDAKPIAVYKTQLTGGSGEELFRLGAATSVDFDLERQTLADPRVSEEVNALSTRIAGKKGSPREEGFTPFLNRDDIQPNIGGLRRNREKEFYGLTLADALEELTAGGYMASPDVADAYSRILARAAATGEMPTGFGDKPMRGTVESLRSGIDPATPRRRSTNPGQDSPEVTAGKQLRAALLDHVEATGQGVPAEEAVKWAGAIGSRWGVDANTVLTAASDPANDPGRALFAPGSNAEEILQQAVRGESGGRRVDLFSEPPARTPKGGRVKVSDPSVRPGVIDEDDFAEVQARQGSFGITKRKETPRDNDPLEPVFAMAAQYKANPAEAEYLAKAAIAENWSRVERGLGDDLPAVMQSLAAPTTRQVMVGQKPYASKEASAVRTKGQKAPTGRPQLRSYADFANAMGEEVGSERQERALTEMALRMRAREGSQAAVNEEASNVPQRIDQGVPAEQLNAPTSGPTPDSGMDAAAIAGTPDEGAPGGYANARLAALKRRLLQR